MSYPTNQSIVPDQVPTAPTISVDDLAAPWRRIVALLVDGLIMGFPIGFIIGIWLATTQPESTEDVSIPAAFLLLNLAAVVYQVVGVALWGQTLGKKMLGIRVVSAQDLSQPGWWRAIRRWGLYFVIGLIPIVGGIVACMILPLVGLVMLFVDQRRQAPHDKVADTIVVNDGVHRWA